MKPNLYLRLMSVDGKLPCPEELRELSRILNANGFEVIEEITENARGGYDVYFNKSADAIDLDKLVAVLQEMRFSPGL